MNYYLDRLRHVIVDRFGNPMTCGDNPDPRDYVAGEAPKVRLPQKVSLYSEASKFGFKIKKQSKNSCTAYSETHRAEIENTLGNGELVTLNAEEQWAWQLQTGASKEGGDWIQNAKKQFQKHNQGYPQTEYRRIFDKNIIEIKKWLALKRPLNTGVPWYWISNLGMSNMQYMMETGIWTTGNYKLDSAHAITFTGYDDSTRMFEFIESEKLQRKDKKHPDGMFHISYDELHEIMSMYMSFDCKD